jgi:hypothetical protein
MKFVIQKDVSLKKRLNNTTYGTREKYPAKIAMDYAFRMDIFDPMSKF